MHSVAIEVEYRKNRKNITVRLRARTHDDHGGADASVAHHIADLILSTTISFSYSALGEVIMASMVLKSKAALGSLLCDPEVLNDFLEHLEYFVIGVHDGLFLGRLLRFE